MNKETALTVATYQTLQSSLYTYGIGCEYVINVPNCAPSSYRSMDQALEVMREYLKNGHDAKLSCDFYVVKKGNK